METETGYTKEELSYFAEGASEPCIENIIEPMDRTVSIRVRNAVPTSIGPTTTATIFSGDQNPLIQPLGITVEVMELVNKFPASHNYLRTDILTKNIAIMGVKYFVSDKAQMTNPVTVLKTSPTGKQVQYIWHPSDFLSPTNKDNTIADAPDFGLIIDGQVSIQIPLNGTNPPDFIPTEVSLVFTVVRKLAPEMQIFNKPPQKRSTGPRLTGNPIADIQIMKQYNK